MYSYEISLYLHLNGTLPVAETSSRGWTNSCASQFIHTWMNVIQWMKSIKDKPAGIRSCLCSCWCSSIMRWICNDHLNEELADTPDDESQWRETACIRWNVIPGWISLAPVSFLLVLPDVWMWNTPKNENYKEGLGARRKFEERRNQNYIS
jgi:hypothetical protein